MKPAIYFILSVMMFATARDCKSQNNNLEISIRKIYKIPRDSFVFTGNYYSIEILMINKSNSPIKFWMWSCSWVENWETNSKNVIFDYPDCNNNVPIISTINPNGKLIITGKLKVLKENYDLMKNIRIGFIMIREDEYHEETFNFYEILGNKHKENKDIYWSEPFNITEKNSR